MSTEDRNLETARRYLAAIEQGAEGGMLAAFYTADVIQEEYPNRLLPAGARRNLAAIQAAAARGKQAVSAQHYEIRSAVASGDLVALAVRWSGTLAMAFGPLAVGDKIHAEIAIFLEFRDGKIAVQRNYDCYEPWWIARGYVTKRYDSASRDGVVPISWDDFARKPTATRREEGVSC